MIPYLQLRLPRQTGNRGMASIQCSASSVVLPERFGISLFLMI